MHDQKPSGQQASGDKKSGWLTIENARNLGLIIASVAVTYAAINTAQQATATRPAPAAPLAVAAPAPSQPIPAQSPAPKPTGDSLESNGRLDLGQDERSEAFKEFLKVKIDELNKAGPVVYATEPVAPEPLEAVVSSAQAPVAPQESPSLAAAPQAVQQPASQEAHAPTGSTEPVKGTTSKGFPMTTHPAPFVDAVAKASLESKRVAFAKSGQPGVAKIGYNVDGSIMGESEKQEQIRSTLTNIPDEWTIIYKAPQEKVRLYVFTDPSCPYCKKLHRALPQLQQAGISVHYLMYPRDMATVAVGQVSPTGENMRNIWCTPDQRAAMDSAFLGYRVPDADCAALPKSIHRTPPPVPDHYNMGQMFDVQGTPTMFASNGRSAKGFGEAQELISYLLR
ncbi:thioredoxin fold domain-containing protein [Pseudomonas serbica]|uniref:thioredoxin fold domain-containing protein n=1 Tax=Pseudomonas serbica TaxID=2965074 RepID=UPI00237B78B2|nr:thioredoxin fold domain-containing protein [Pseudomonas serbica]